MSNLTNLLEEVKEFKEWQDKEREQILLDIKPKVILLDMVEGAEGLNYGR